MRLPTADPYAWWRAALTDRSTPRFDGEPQAGFYKRRMVRNGPFLPVEVKLISEVDEAGELSAPETYTAEQLGRSQDAARIWTHLRPITEAEFDALVEEHRTNDLMAATHAAVNLTQSPTLPKGY
jgi:hypothetical protein